MNPRHGRFLLPPLAVAACLAGIPATASATQISGSVTIDSAGAADTLSGQRQLLDRLGALGVLDFQWVARTKTATGETVRRQAGVIDVPTLLNVDADPLPDLVGTIQVLSLSRFTIRVDRLLGETATLPTKLEAIVDDPTGILPRRRINVGFDARAARTPSTWRTVAELPEDGNPLATTLNLTQEASDAGASVTTVGGLFNGDSLDRKDAMGGGLTYSPAPRQTTLGLTLGPAMEIRAGASAPVDVTGTAELVDGTRAQRVGLGLKGLPRSMSVNIAELGENQRRIVYAASAPVPSVEATYTDTQEGAIDTKVVAKAVDVPTGMTVEQTGRRSGTYAATGGVLGSVEAGFANGEPRLLPGADHPYARIFDDGTLASYAGRVDALQAATVDATDDVHANLQLGRDERKPLRTLVDMPGRHVDGTVSDLPRHLDITYAPSTGRIVYDAFGETIGQIDVEAAQDTVLFGRVKRVKGRIAGLPAHAEVTITPGGGGLRMTTDEPIGRADALLSSGPDAELPAGVYGARIVDTAERFTAVGRVKGLRSVDVEMGADEAIDAHARLDPTPLTLGYVKDALKVDAELSQIPDDLRVTFAPRAGTATYRASAGLGRIDATMTDQAPLFGRVKRVVARVEQLPASLDLGFRPEGGAGVKVTAVPGVGKIEARLTDGRIDSRAIDGDGSGVVFTDTAEEFSVFGRLRGLREARVLDGPGGLEAELKTAEPQDVTVDATLGATTIDAAVTAMPGELKLVQAGDDITYDASAGVPQVDVDARNLPGGGEISNVVGTLTGVPAHLRITNSAAALGVEATQGGSIGRVELDAFDGHGASPDGFEPDGRNKLRLVTRDGRMAVKARVADLQRFRLGLTSTRVETAFGPDPQPLDMQVLNGTGDAPERLEVGVSDLPRSSTFILTQTTGLRVGWEAPFGSATDVALRMSGRDLGANLALTDLPSSTHVCIGSGPTQCDAESKQRVNVDPPNPLRADQVVDFPNDFTAFVSANGVLRLDGQVCMPPTDDEGEGRTGDVYDSCIDGSAPNRIRIQGLELKGARIEIATGDVKTDAGEDFDDGLLKLFLKTGAEGIEVGRLDVTNATAGKETTIQAGDPALTHSGQFFFGLFDLTLPPSIEDEPRIGQLQCDDLTVAVQLPVLGKTDVLPGGGELLVGDVCLDD